MKTRMKLNETVLLSACESFVHEWNAVLKWDFGDSPLAEVAHRTVVVRNQRKI